MILLILLMTNLAMTAPLEPAVKIRCGEGTGPYQRFDFDLYITGHPQGGISIYSGIFRVERLDGSSLTGHIDTTSEARDLLFYGSAGDIDKVDFRLRVPTDYFREGVIYDATLKFNRHGPFGPGSWDSQSIRCEDFTIKSQGLRP